MTGSVYVTKEIPEAGLNLLRENFDDVEINLEKRVIAKEELMTKVKGKDGVLCLLTDKIDKDIIQAAGSAKIFANYAVGFDNIDIKAATENGIMITNTPGVLTDATADLAWALIFASARRIVEADKYVRQGNFVGWDPMLFLGNRVTNATLGIFGAGRIGTAVALKAGCFQMRVLYCDEKRNEELEAKVRARKVEKEFLLQESDFISLHVPLDKDTFHLIGKEELRKMKKSASLINTSRGPVIDENALVEALRKKEIHGAALDVFENEPQLSRELMELDNVVIVPHIGSATTETREKMAVMAANNIIKALKGEIPPNIVNPEVIRRK